MPRIHSPVRPAPKPVDVKHLIQTVFKPSPEDQFAVWIDLPTANFPDHEAWKTRRTMAEEWLHALRSMGINTLPLVSYDATGAHNAAWPSSLLIGEKKASPLDALNACSVVIAMTEFSATAPLLAAMAERKEVRAASMPGVTPAMLRSALAADYNEVNDRAQFLRALLNRAVGARVHFSLGQECYFDLRFRQARADGGLCHPDMDSPRLINLPAGEAFKVPYEGERPGELSDTVGMLPIVKNRSHWSLFVQNNLIEEVIGESVESDEMRAMLDKDPARRNIAEFGIGCNPQAALSGMVIEEEKAGFHIAIGRSEHLGGIMSPNRFLSPATVLHQDFVYAPGSPAYAESILLVMDDGSETMVIERGFNVALDDA